MKNTFVGKVVSDKMLKTVVVAVDLPKKHPIYNKEIKNTRKFMAHNEKSAKIGDTVRIEESKPISKNKSWVVVEVLGDK